MPARRRSGFRLISEGATIDGRSIAAARYCRCSAPAALPGSPTGCFYFKEEGTLFVARQYPGLCRGDRQDRFFGRTQLDQARPPERQQCVARSSARRRLQFNYVLDSDLWAACVRPAALPAWRSSRRSSRAFPASGTAAGTGGRGARARERLQLRQHFFRARSGSVADLSQHHLRRMTDRTPSCRRISPARPRSMRRQARTIC